MSEKIMILDCETTNDIDCPLTYDIGFRVCDLEGKTYATHSYVVSDIFCDKALMESAFFKDKVPQYWVDIKEGARVMKSLNSIRKIIKFVCALYGIDKMFAFNVRFDYMAMNNTQRYLTKSKYRWFLPWGVECYDILKLARLSLKDDKDYTKFCVDNEYLDKRGHNRHTAEIVYRYWFDNEFVESHTGLEDTEIEYKILLKCLKNHTLNEGKLWS